MKLLHRLVAIRLFSGVRQKPKNNLSMGMPNQAIQEENCSYRARVMQILEATRGAFHPDVWAELRPLENGIRRDLEKASSKEKAQNYIRWRLSHFQSDNPKIQNVLACLKGNLALIH